MARAKKAEIPAGEVAGRILVDVPRLGFKSGEYVSLPADVAAELQAAGDFDPNAKAE